MQFKSIAALLISCAFISGCEFKDGDPAPIEICTVPTLVEFPGSGSKRLSTDVRIEGLEGLKRPDVRVQSIAFHAVSGVNDLRVIERARVKVSTLQVASYERVAGTEVALSLEFPSDGSVNVREHFSADSALSLQIELEGELPAAAWSADVEVCLGEEIGPSKFVSLSGDDSSNGSLTSPWKSIKESVLKLEPGETLYVRGGRYLEEAIDLDGLGSEEAPIRVQNFPGEEVIVDGGFAEFREPGNADWELCTAENCDPKTVGKNIYRSVGTYPRSAMVTGYFEWKAVNYRLIPYKTDEMPVSPQIETCDGRVQHGLDYLVSDHHDYEVCKPRYLGPGHFYDETDNRIYIRMVAPLPTATFQAFDLPSDPDPRKLAIVLSRYNYGFYSSSTKVSRVELSGMKIHNHLFPIGGIFEHSRFERLDLRPGMVGIRLESSRHVTIDRIELDGFLPPWVAWTDIKGGETPASRIRAAGITDGGAHDVVITNSVIQNVFDGMLTTHGLAHGFKVLHNRFIGIWDDTIQLGARTYDIEFAYNHVEGAGLSHDGGAAQHDDVYESRIGTKYIHHNVFDNSKKLLWGRHDPMRLRVVMDGQRGLNQVGWLNPAVFTAHYGKGFFLGDPWKVYNNTFLISDRADIADPSIGLWGNVSEKGIPHEVYNNIFQLVDASVFLKNNLAMSGHEIFDGNVFYQGKNNPAKSCDYAFLKSSDSRVTVPNSPAFNFSATEGFTIAMWVRLNGRLNNDPLGPRITLASRYANARGVTLSVLTSGPFTGGVFAETRNGASTGNVGLTRIDDGAWHHVAFVVDRAGSGTAAIYVDGKLDSSKLSLAGVGAIDDVTTDLKLGLNLNGALDEFQVFRRALTAEELSAAVSSAPGPSADWSLESALQSQDAVLGLFKPEPVAGVVGTAYAFSGFDGMLSFPTLDDFKRSPLRKMTQSFYAPGWESQGIDADPLLGADLVPSAQGPAAVRGVDLSGKGWPGTSPEESGFRGAFAPR